MQTVLKMNNIFWGKTIEYNAQTPKIEKQKTALTRAKIAFCFVTICETIRNVNLSKNLYVAHDSDCSERQQGISPCDKKCTDLSTPSQVKSNGVVQNIKQYKK